MRLLLFSDPHITDSPNEEYRWVFFEKTLPELITKHEINQVWCLGDLSDRRDRHSGVLVNRLVAALTSLQTPTYILQANHDAAVGDKKHYWEFLSEIRGVSYITRPTNYDGILALPFSPNPKEDWAQIPLHANKAIFMHQTVAGAEIEGGRKINEESGHNLPFLPRGVPIYSGDVHRPQILGPITYVGTPYPVRFGEDWQGRVLILDAVNLGKYEEILLPTMNRKILDLNAISVSQFEQGNWKPGDQVRIRYHMSTSQLDSWGHDEPLIRTAAAKLGVQILSVETVLNEDITSIDKTLAAPSSSLEGMDTEATLRLFCSEEAISGDIMTTGIDIMRKTT